MVHIFTSITSNYIPKARVLAQSVKSFHPEFAFHLVLSDTIPSTINLINEPFDSIITAEELSIPELKSWLFKHSLVEMCTGVKGFAFQEIFKRYNCEQIIYFDPDIVVTSKLDSLIDKFADGSVLLTPHQTIPEKTNEAVVDNEICSLRHGVYNLGFLGIKNSFEGQRFLDWWSKRCLDFCYNNIPGGLFTDQKWVDLAPAFFEDLAILREPIYNVATWNLTHRTASGSLQDGILIDGKPLCFYHFSGFDSGAQEVMLKKYGNSSPVLFEFRKWYINECEKLGQSTFGKIPCYYSFFDNGEAISNEQRLLYRQRIDLQKAYPNPFYVTENFDTSKSYLHWYMAHGEDAIVKELYNYSQPNKALEEAHRQLEIAQNMIMAMETSKFWKLRKAWFKVKDLPVSIKNKTVTVIQKNKGKLSSSFQNFTQNIKQVNNQLKASQQEIICQLNHRYSIVIENPRDNSPVNGLILLVLKFYPHDASLTNTKLELSLNQGAWESLKLNNLEDHKLTTVINSFWLTNGNNNLQVRLTDNQDNILGEAATNFVVKNQGNLANLVKECLQKSSDQKVIIQGLIDSTDFPYSDSKSLEPWFDQPNALEKIPEIIKKYNLSDTYNQKFANFVNFGYISLDEFIPQDFVNQVNNDIDKLIGEGFANYTPESGDRIEHLFQKSEKVKYLWKHPEILKILTALFDDVAIPCQTLNFIHGSQQDVHQDIIHLTPFPEGYMCGVWIALEDINPDAGPLVAYPKSHRIPAIYAQTINLEKRENHWNKHLENEYINKYLTTLKDYLVEYNLEPMIYTPKAGSVFIWHSGLVHGGTARNIQNLTRKSMVSHYFAQGSIAYYDITGTIAYKHFSI